MLVLKEFKLDENADEYLYISGRSEGIWAYLLTLIGIDTTTELRCNSKSLLFKTASLRKGQADITIPNSAVTAVVTGFHKPFALLVVAALFLLGGLSAHTIWSIALGLVVAAVCVFLYYIGKSTLFGVYNGGDHPIAALYIKRSVIEGVSITFEKYQSAALLLNKAVLECQHQKS